MTRRAAQIRRHTARFLAILFLIFQGAILDYYLINGEEYGWFAWIITDLVVLVTWIAAMVMSYHRLNNDNASITNTQGIMKDELAFAYLAWLVYALHLVPQVATLFRRKVGHLDEEQMFFGPNTLKMCLCITPCLFLFLIFAHHNSRPHTVRKFYLEKMTSAVTIDLFDSVEMLEYLFEEGEIPKSVSLAILSFSCINFFLPVLALYELKHNKFRENGQVASVSYKIVYILMFMFFVNIPFLVIRLYLWHDLHKEISVLLAKNGLAIILGLVEIMEFCGDERPRRCATCSGTYAKAYYKNHLKMCSSEANELQTLQDAPPGPSTSSKASETKTHHQTVYL